MNFGQFVVQGLKFTNCSPAAKLHELLRQLEKVRGEQNQGFKPLLSSPFESCPNIPVKANKTLETNYAVGTASFCSSAVLR